MTKETAIVLTTIRKPDILQGLCSNILKFGHEKNTRIYVIGDNKTPDIDKYVRDQPVEALYFTADEQREIRNEYTKFQKAMDNVPYNNDARRNVGLLFALEDRYEKFINLDDDNFPLDNVDYVGSHNIVGTIPSEMDEVRSANNWFNSGQIMLNDHNSMIYQRGFPYSLRWKDSATYKLAKPTSPVALNEGLWLSTPDADAISHIISPVNNIAMLRERLLLAQGVWTPMNTQNTAVSGAALPAFMFVAGSMMHETNMNRLGDIWCGYLAQRIVQHMGDRSTIGNPLVDHRRNSHNYPKDAFQEVWGMYYMDAFMEYIQRQELFDQTYSGAYAALGDSFTRYDVTNDVGMNKFFVNMGKQMRIWAETCEDIM